MGIILAFAQFLIGQLGEIKDRLNAIQKQGEIMAQGFEDLKTQINRIVTDATTEINAVKTALEAAAASPTDADLTALAAQLGGAADALEAETAALTPAPAV